MLRRILRGQDLPFINALVDIGNVISLQYKLPIGCHAIDVLKGDITLHPASGQEDFLTIGSSTVEHPEPGRLFSPKAILCSPGAGSGGKGITRSLCRIRLPLSITSMVYRL